MKTDELWAVLTKHEVSRSSFFGRPLLIIHEKDFEQFKDYFLPQFALLNSYENYRSSGWWRHIHAIKRSDGVQIHVDHGNPNSHVFLNIPHGFLDVIPYFLWCLLTWQKPYSF